ncbi:hypothetical protein FSP39_025134 [Pinctada imbricata]|uniref:Uncharacterized protein n=1 Tax=Pinctada imbricata TaxID=66713 RepID=A0AA88Y2F1_PINIB|nr:hypothetical protein FSP39_025134 [Pinctada imbricata]
MVRILHFFVFLHLGIIEIYSQNKTDYQNVYTKIFTTNAYNKKILPRPDIYHPIILDISFFFLGINEIDELNEKFVTTGFLWIQWADEGLSWSPIDHNNLERIYVPQNDVWKPDIVLANGFKRFVELGGEFYFVEVQSAGLVIWIPFEVFESRCSLDTSKYPFDSQVCNITFVVWSHSVAEVEILNSTQGFEYDENYQENSVWKIQYVTYTVSKQTRESRINFSFHMKRKPLYYVINILLPVIFLGLLNGLVFVIPAGSGEKTGFSITVFLSLSVFLTIISSLLPTNSDNTSILGVYLLIQVVFGVIVLFITTLQLRLSHRTSAVPTTGCCAKLARCTRRLRCKKNAVSDENTVIEINNEHKEMSCDEEADVQWSDVVSEMDYLFFLLYYIVYLSFTGGVFAFLVMG